MKRYRVVHTTSYEYSQPVSLCHNEAHLSPRDCEYQRRLRHQLRIDPLPEVRTQREDYFGNTVAYFAVQEAHQQLTVTATSEVEFLPLARVEEADSPPWDQVRDRLMGDAGPEALAAREFLLDSPMVANSAALAEYARASFSPGRPLLQAARELMERIHSDFVYDPHFTTVATPLSEVMDHRRGVCQDFAHLAIGCLRSMGLPARYVSGYIESQPPPGGPRLVGADASHAWASVYVPGNGWVDFDPTNALLPTAVHITIAWGRDYSDVTPLKGVILGGGKHTLSVAVDVLPMVDPDPTH